jgi:DNA-binding GntR family transcriptional regulator
MPSKWERVADAIRQQIRDNTGLTEREDGRYLPSYPQLIDQHNVSYSTVRMVIAVLKAEGWIEGEQGIGLRVREDHPK